ncbi:hypothetical protein CDEST_02054 [Colletotrichum destructivum]|uniref:Uncharacterized protein n=1 Tax=Colletotrichum destructivum TaxID=34406 RepID=A0AAX4I241_9PEZI|nr:hypothetical protein CDEST_01954 [Colletotrichum destructivum]WQF77040.1 hypothetical protein CDEST_02054 [Colletotrichum destructivum]
MYQPQTGRAPPRLSRQIPRQSPYLLRHVRVPYKSGYHQAAGGDVRAQRQGPVTSAAQGKDNPNSSSINPQMLSASSISSSRKVSETQEDNPELRYLYFASHVHIHDQVEPARQCLNAA